MQDILKKHKKVLIIGIMIVLVLVVAVIMLRWEGSSTTGGKGTPIKERNLEKVGDTLRAAGLSNVDLFETWVYEYYESEDSNLPAYSDADCRLTAMLLLDDQISCDNTEEYKGDYLMVDVDKLEHEGAYMFIRDNLQVFTTLFGEMPIPESGIENALPDNWKKNGLKVFNENASLVSVVFTTLDTEEVFVGHTGVLIDCRKLEDTEYENYLFVEKIAFGDKFMATEIESPEELTSLLSERPDYTTEKGEPKALVYINDKLLGELKQ